MNPALLILVLFGLAFGVRWVIGWGDASPLSLPSDTALVVAGLLSVAGIRRSLHLPPRLQPRILLWAAGGFATTHLMMLMWLGPMGRHGVFNLCLGGLHAVLAWYAVQFRRLPASVDRPPTSLIVLGAGSLLLLALVRTAGGVLVLWSSEPLAPVVWVDAVYMALSGALGITWGLMWVGWRYRVRRVVAHNASS